jgi:pilus assembly protein TadC
MSLFITPTTLAIIASISILIFLQIVIERLNASNISKKRFSTLQSQLKANRPLISKDKILSEKSSIDNEAIRLSQRLVRKNYRDRLINLSNQKGGASESVFSKLLKQKIYFSVIGLALSFLLVAQGRWILVLPTLVITFFAYLLPSSLSRLSRIFSRSYGRKLGNMAMLSGSKWQSPERLIRAKIMSALITFIGGYLYAVIISRSLSSIFLLFLGVILGFFVPDIILYNNVAKRREKFAEALPDAIDLLTMCVNAGLAFPQSLAKVSDIQKGPVSEEFIRVRTEVQLGKERNVALGEMADRIKLDSLTNFVNAVAQVDRFGIPISAVLLQQSVELRAERKAKGREKAQKVPIKILGPVMLCFLPCVIIIVLGPAIIGILGSF